MWPLYGDIALTLRPSRITQLLIATPFNTHQSRKLTIGYIYGLQLKLYVDMLNQKAVKAQEFGATFGSLLFIFLSAENLRVSIHYFCALGIILNFLWGK